MSEFDDQNVFPTMCRLCLNQNVELVGVYSNNEFNSTTAGSSNKIVEIIERFTTVEV